MPHGSCYAPSICRGVCSEACSTTLAPGRAQPNAEATLRVWLGTLMGDCRGKSPCRQNFREDGTLCCPYASFVGRACLGVVLCVCKQTLMLNRAIYWPWSVFLGWGVRQRELQLLHVPPRAASRLLTHSPTHPNNNMISELI